MRPQSTKILYFNKRCNLNCSYCFVNKTDKYDEAIKELDLIQVGKDLITEHCKEEGNPYLDMELMGGELLLVQDQLVDSIEELYSHYLKVGKDPSKDFGISIITNGTVPMTDRFKHLLNTNPSAYAQVSIDSTNEEANSARVDLDGNNITKGVIKYIEDNAEYISGLSTVFTPKTAGHFGEVIELGIKNGITNFSVSVDDNIFLGGYKNPKKVIYDIVRDLRISASLANITEPINVIIWTWVEKSEFTIDHEGETYEYAHSVKRNYDIVKDDPFWTSVYTALNDIANINLSYKNKSFKYK